MLNTIQPNSKWSRYTLQAWIKLLLVIVLLAILIPYMIAQDLETVPSLDLKRYTGKWYEIASFPQSFQKGCTCTTAEYTWTEHGYLVVENRCWKGGENGYQAYIKGKAFVVDNSGNAKLKVQFFWPFRAKYWVIDLADDYSYAVVSHPNRKYLWILARESFMDPQVYDGIVSRLRQKGFDISKLQLTEHRQ